MTTPESGLDDAFGKAMEFASDLIRIPSLPGREEAVARRVLEEFERLGLEDVALDELGSVRGRVPGRGSAPPIQLSSHLDVVAAGDPSTWEYPPFDGLTAAGFLHGRGAMDIKGPLAIQTHAAALLGGRSAGDVWLVHTVLEERGGWGMEHHLQSAPFVPAAVIIGESTNGDITIGHRGRAEVEVVLRGRAGHASAPHGARNPFHMLPAVLEGIQRLEEDQPAHPELGSATLAVTDISARPESRNVIPDEVVLALDWRILPGSEGKELLELVQMALQHIFVPEDLSWEVRMAREYQESWTGVRRLREVLTPGFLMEAGDPVVQAAATAVGRREETGARATVRPWTFATDGGWSHGVSGVPTLGFAPGEERYAHTNRERLELDSARWAFDRYPILIEAVQFALT
ncbi:MAG: M20/M25/M40 family metallo-hydrolase [Gemmatimonadota bacterium]